jgi:hypothetical protein
MTEEEIQRIKEAYAELEKAITDLLKIELITEWLNKLLNKVK